MKLRIVPIVGAGLLAALAGCTSDNYSRAPAGPDAAVGLKLQPSSRQIVSGEVVTVSANTENLLGRNAEMRWEAPGGRIATEDSGRIARVMFERPGTYTITGHLFVDGREIRQDQVTVKVNPLR
jgi:hypothetical protein